MVTVAVLHGGGEGGAGVGLAAPLSFWGGVDATTGDIIDRCHSLFGGAGPGEVRRSDAGKGAYYAPANIGAGVVFGSTADCSEAAVSGQVTRDDRWWGASW